tara:strand:+ start:216 stop:1076 length:861 start_codon:yes stop_codon:yes gene_type:complete
MILVIGASGAVGIPLLKNLLETEQHLRVLTSNKSSEERLKSLGVKETIVGDWSVSSDLKTAMSGIKSVCYIPARFKENELETGRGIVDAAKAEGVDHFCFSSAFHPQMEQLGHHWKKLRLEEYLIDSDLLCTVVQPSMFMQNLKVEWPKVINEGIYPRPYSIDSPMNVIDTDDLGEAISNILQNKEFWGATYELCGSGTISHRQMAKIISEEIQKPVEAVYRELDDWKSWAKEKGWTEYAIEQYVNMCTHYDKHGFKHGNDIVLKTILGRKPTNYRTFIQKYSKIF